jgi:hypothetical protein
MTLTPEQQSDNGPKMQPGTNTTIVNYKTSVVKNYHAMSSLVRFENKNIFVN